MKYAPPICCRTILAAMLTLVFLAASSLAGVAPGGPVCDAACCRPLGHHSQNTGNGGLGSIQPKTCCSGMENRGCDLHALPGAPRPHLFQAIHCSVHYGLAAAPVDNSPGPVRVPGAVARSNLIGAPPGSIPIYIATQSILI